MIIKKKRQYQPNRYNYHQLASQYTYQLVNSNLIDEEEISEISRSTLENITGKTIKKFNSSPEDFLLVLDKLRKQKDTTPSLTKRLTNNINTLVSCLQLDEVAGDIIKFTAIMNLNKGLSELINSYVYYNIDSLAQLLSVILDTDELVIETSLTSIWSTGLLITSKLSPEEPLMLPTAITRKLVTQSLSNTNEILNDILTRAPAPELTLKHFNYLDMSLAKRYLKKALKIKLSGVNILFHGAPGTGKTQLTRILAKEIGADLLEIVPVGGDLWSRKNEYSSTETSGALRLQFNKLVQKLLSKSVQSLLVIDECEDLFAFINGEDRISKEALHRLLENNTLPTIWITNHVEHLDESCLRRFKMIVEFPKPSTTSIKILIDDSLKGLSTSENFRKTLATTKHLTMANVDNAACVVKQVGLKRKEAEHNINTLIESTLSACGYKHEIQYQAALNFNINYINLSGSHTDVSDLIQATKNYSSARTLLTGMSGTGKTALVNHLAQSLDMELITVRCSDILSKYVGESEQKVAQAFKQATESEAILFFDEVDSLLSSRENMNSGHEVQLVNELLTQIECFQFPLFAATNFSSRLDKAVMRRFDFKLQFNPLKNKQVNSLFCETMRCKTLNKNISKQLNQLTMLTPGDFAIIARRNEFNTSLMTQQNAIKLLMNENKRKSASQQIGFI